MNDDTFKAPEGYRLAAMGEAATHAVCRKHGRVVPINSDDHPCAWIKLIRLNRLIRPDQLGLSSEEIDADDLIRRLCTRLRNRIAAAGPDGYATEEELELFRLARFDPVEMPPELALPSIAPSPDEIRVEAEAALGRKRVGELGQLTPCKACGHFRGSHNDVDDCCEAHGCECEGFVEDSEEDLRRGPDAEPEPQPGVAEVTPLVIGDLQRRSDFGARKYGTRLQTFNGRNALVDAYQEALDHVCYLRQRIEEEKTAAAQDLRVLELQRRVAELEDELGR